MVLSGILATEHLQQVLYSHFFSTCKSQSNTASLQALYHNSLPILKNSLLFSLLNKSIKK